MGRSLGLPVTVVSLVVGAVLFVMQMQSQGPTAPATRQVETQAVQAVSSVNFSAADEMVRTYFAANGTYAGVTLDPSFMATVVRADATSYCLQGGVGGAVQHETGPGGTAAAGPC